MRRRNSNGRRGNGAHTGGDGASGFTQLLKYTSLNSRGVGLGLFSIAGSVVGGMIGSVLEDMLDRAAQE